MKKIHILNAVRACNERSTRIAMMNEVLTWGNMFDQVAMSVRCSSDQNGAVVATYKYILCRAIINRVAIIQSNSLDGRADGGMIKFKLSIICRTGTSRSTCILKMLDGHDVKNKINLMKCGAD